jgi:hypothetical protein
VMHEEAGTMTVEANAGMENISGGRLWGTLNTHTQSAWRRSGDEDSHLGTVTATVACA